MPFFRAVSYVKMKQEPGMQLTGTGMQLSVRYNSWVPSQIYFEQNGKAHVSSCCPLQNDVQNSTHCCISGSLLH